MSELRFHWMLPKGGEVVIAGPQTPREAARYRIESLLPTSPAPRPDMPGWTHFALAAEEAGIESVLISFSRYEPDPITVATALGLATRRLGFIIATRSGLMQPTTFVQQINTLSTLIPGRVAVNVVAGSSRQEQRGYGDFLEHDDRYARAEEFLAVCHAFWRGGAEVDFDGRYYKVEKGKLHTPFADPVRSAPEIFISGHSEASERLAFARGSTYLRVLDTPEKLQRVVGRVREHGLEVCLRCCVICRPTREEAIAVARSLLPADQAETTNAHRDDSQMYREGNGMAKDEHWLNRSIWTGLVPHYGPVWTVLLGTPEELGEALLEYKQIGVTEFILSGWPEVDEVRRFGAEVLPRVREAERAVCV
ncbi:MAG TPA: LLM class flavin-dependent oxidoreductase [Thermoanaerobaculia bacterium]|jgi:alkanesulfonate monooxygenase|nr:LLM class flavin-dependent oxidoreductase [Thermoanaerobaculia bacterium]